MSAKTLNAKTLIQAGIFICLSLGYLRGEVSAEETDKAGEIITEPNIIYNAENLRDPFQSYIKETPVPVKPEIIEEIHQVPLPYLEVQGLFWGGKFPQAIINNNVVKEGDMIDGVKIISIKKDGVAVLFGNKEHRLSPPKTANLESL